MGRPRLKSFVIHLQSLNQIIDSPIIAGPGSVNGNSITVVLSQEAAAQITPNTKVYLNWKHLDKDISGYSIINQIDDYTWSRDWPQEMQWSGDVICRIELVDTISISVSNNFTVHFVNDFNKGDSFIASNDYSEFQKAVLELNSIADQMKEDILFYEEVFDSYQETIDDIKNTANTALEKAEQALKQNNE